MTVLRGRRLASVGSKETYTITHPALTENSGLTTVLPTTEPGTSQIIVTVASGDLYLPAGLIGAYIGVILAQVLNNDGATRTVSWRMIKNGSSVNTGTVSVATTQRARIQPFFSPTAVSGDAGGQGLVAGDVIELRLWCASSTNVQLVYWTYYLLDTRTKPTGSQGVRDASLTTPAAFPALASWPGGGGAAVVSSSRYAVGDSQTLTAALAVSTTFSGIKAMMVNGYGLIQANLGDAAGANTISSNIAAAPNYATASVLSSVTVRRDPVA